MAELGLIVVITCGVVVVVDLVVGLFVIVTTCNGLKCEMPQHKRNSCRYSSVSRHARKIKLTPAEHHNAAVSKLSNEQISKRKTWTLT